MLGIVSALAGLLAIPYLLMGFDELIDALRGHLPADFPKWDPYGVVGVFGALCFGAFFMSFRLLRHAFFAKPPNCPVETPGKSANRKSSS